MGWTANVGVTSYNHLIGFVQGQTALTGTSLNVLPLRICSHLVIDRMADAGMYETLGMLVSLYQFYFDREQHQGMLPTVTYSTQQTSAPRFGVNVIPTESQEFVFEAE